MPDDQMDLTHLESAHKASLAQKHFLFSKMFLLHSNSGHQDNLHLLEMPFLSV